MWKSILITTLIAGTLDLTAAFLNAYISNGVMPNRVLAYIASGIWGKTAFNGNVNMLLFGLLFHFIIVFTCVLCFFWIYPKWSFLHQSTIVNAILIALAAWFITTQLVIRLSQITVAPFRFLNTLIAIGILIVCIGLPIAYSAKQTHTSTLLKNNQDICNKKSVVDSK